jgi:transposase
MGVRPASTLPPDRADEVVEPTSLAAPAEGHDVIATSAGGTCLLPKLKQYVGSHSAQGDTVAFENDELVWCRSEPSTPESITEAVRKHACRAVGICLEARQLSSWLYHGLKAKVCPVTCIDARHAKRPFR